MDMKESIMIIRIKICGIYRQSFFQDLTIQLVQTAFVNFLLLINYHNQGNVPKKGLFELQY